MVRFRSSVGPKTYRSGSLSSRENVFSARASMASVIKNYQKFVKHVEDVTPEILLEALEPTFELSQEYCPTATGRLRNSGYLEITQFRGVPTVEIGYGRGSEPPYAATVHENVEWRHKPPTRAKWLQAALVEDEKGIQDRIVTRLRAIAG